MLTGPGSTVGDELYSNPDVDGLTFTGSYAVGMQIYRNFAKDYPKPAICEMGGKNPAIVSAKADLDKATDGVHAQRLRLRRPEVLARARACTSNAPPTTSSSRSWSRRRRS